MRSHTSVACQVLGALAAKEINISMINTSEVCLTVVIERRYSQAALL
jgi:aspartate kinase